MKGACLERRLDAYLNGDLWGRRAAAVAAHLERCPVCRRQAAEFERLAVDLRGLAGDPVPAHLASRAVDRWLAERSRRPWFAPSRPALALGAAGILLLLGFRGGLPEPSPAANGTQPLLAAESPALPTPVAAETPPQPQSGSREARVRPSRGQMDRERSPHPTSNRSRRLMVKRQPVSRVSRARGEQALRGRGRSARRVQLARQAPERAARGEVAVLWAERAKYHAARGEHGQAAAAYQAAFAALPDATLALAAGESAESAGDLVGAVTYYTQLFDAAPGGGEQE